MTLPPLRRKEKSLETVRAFNDAIRRVAEDKQLEVVPIDLLFDWDLSYFPDLKHPNEEGHRLIAVMLFSILMSGLDRV